MPVLIGFPMPQASADDSNFSFDDVLYWTSDMYTENFFYAGVGCALNPDKLWPCVHDVALNGRPLEYLPHTNLSPNSPLNNKTVTVFGSGSSFSCWAPTWPARSVKPITPLNEQCSYRQYNISIPGTFSDLSLVELPQLTLNVRKINGTHPASHLGFLHASGPVHEFIPTSDTNEFATITMSPGFIVGGSGSFSTNLQTLDVPEYSGDRGGWSYSVFLATSKVSGYFENRDNIGFEMLPESIGAWQASNAANWGFFGDYWKPDYAVRVAAPHFKYKANPSDPDELNTAWFTAYLPRALVQRQFGLTPAQANETNLSVTRSVGRNPTQLPSTFTVLDNGLLISTDGITFSKPAITISRRIEIKRRRKMTVDNIVAATGVPRRSRSTARISSSPCRSSKKNCVISQGKVKFNKRGRYVFRVTYSTKDARKRTVQRTHQVTVRVR